MNLARQLVYGLIDESDINKEEFRGKILMEFTLKYEGIIPTTSSRESRLVEKQQIRLEFHEQLRQLWSTHSRLRDINPKELQQPILKANRFDVNRPIVGGKDFFYRYAVGGFEFVPLVNTPQEVHCHLAIRLHARTGPGDIVFYGGDLDNRLKTIFDALRMPTGLAELPEMSPTEGQTVFCLLEDDRLITRLSIETFRLLKNVADNSYVEMDIDVTVRAVTPMMGTIDLLFP